MDIKVEFDSTAFKHHITEENIRWALGNRLADGLIEEDDENKYLAIGFDKSGNVLEILYNHIREDTIKVFHAMKCRKQFYAMLGLRRTK
ncbi:hypothetical protein AGMMS49940_24240 [Spirochaetia bacterium]|nr:hypothetical protein AGMMS49940_24240 [Spirochaetia bacterium]